MTHTLADRAVERGTFAVDIAFTDEEGESSVPNSGLVWKLTNTLGTVVNSRTAVAISSASTVTIVLSGADLDLDDGNERFVTVEGTYTSDLGENLPIKDEVRFYIRDLQGVT